MFDRKLKALKFPNASNFDVHDDDQFKKMVCWLEDQKIRHLKVEDRSALKNISSQQWATHFSQYLQNIGCPYSVDFDRIALIDWLLGHAVRMDFADAIDAVKPLTAAKIMENRKCGSSLISSNPLDNLDFQSEEFKKGVQDLARILKIPQHPNHLIMLKAICQVISEKLSASAIKQAKNSTPTKKEASADLSTYELGFKTHDSMLDDACKILRLLHVTKMRHLQTNINETIVAVQNLTANPKTDDRLGKIGRS